MNPPQVYMCSPSRTLLPPPSPYHPSGPSQCTSPKHLASCIEPGLVSSFNHLQVKYMLSHSAMSNSLKPPDRLLRLWNFLGKDIGVGCHFLLQDLPQPGIKHKPFVSPALVGGFFTTEPPGKLLQLKYQTLKKKKMRVLILKKYKIYCKTSVS